ncbi:hypothetical protein BC8716_10930 [Shouchella clausii]|nr:hypothetical protein BC8716_10930 [Shouchella clausii]PTL23741.1 hypothetical protein DA802_06320 [Shouchella clausii]QNM42787.1 hypothetical protein DUT88_07785 [Shouchella clausii]
MIIYVFIHKCIKVQKTVASQPDVKEVWFFFMKTILLGVWQLNINDYNAKQFREEIVNFP